MRKLYAEKYVNNLNFQAKENYFLSIALKHFFNPIRIIDIKQIDINEYNVTFQIGLKSFRSMDIII